MSLRPEIRPSGFELRAFVVVVVAVSSVAAAWIVVNAPRSPVAEPEREHATLDVSASATHHVPPDRMTWTITVQRQQRAELTKLLAGQGMTDTEVAIKPVVDFDDAEQPMQNIDVTTSDVARGMRAYRAAVGADWAGTVDVGEPECSLVDSAAAEQAVLTEAQQRVRARAETAAHAYGGRLGRITSATVGEVETDSTSGACDGVSITATANASYELE